MMKKRATAQNKKGHRGAQSDHDTISIMPDGVLFIILSLMTVKDAVAMGCVSRGWNKFVWGNLIHLNFDGGKRLDFMAKVPMLRDSGRSKYINQVNSVIQSHRSPTIQEFQIHFDLDNTYKLDIEHWLRFAVNKQVKMLELDLMDHHMVHIPTEKYDFPLRLSTPDATIVDLLYLRKLVLKGVNMREAVLQEFLKNSPYLETLSIHGSGHLKDIVFGGEPLPLKHLEIANCSYGLQSIYLYEFDLVSFSYNGPSIDVRLANLPAIKELDLGQGAAGDKYNIFGQIASCVSYIQVLSLNLYLPRSKIPLALRFIPELPNVKKLRLTVGAHADNSLLGFTSIANACPCLETFTIQLRWRSPPIRRRRKVRHDGTSAHPYNHLRVLEVLGYYGRISELELVTYIINNAVALQQIVIDPRWQGRIPDATIKKTEKTARSYANKQLKSVMPQGVKLMIL